MSEVDRLRQLAQSDPEAARRLLADLRGKVVHPHPAQQEVLDVSARFKVLDCGRRWGKGLTLGTKVLTPDGWVRNGDLRVGDLVIGSDGLPTEVTGVYPQPNQPIYRVHFSDGVHVDTDAPHQWLVYGRRGHREVVDSARLLREHRLQRSDGRTEARWAVPTVAPVQFPEQELPLDPYLVGSLLGDGALTQHPQFCTRDEESLREVERLLPDGASLGTTCSRGVSTSIRGIKPHLVRLGMHGKTAHTKEVPEAYMRGSVEQRLALLQGLMDTDGNNDRGRAEFTSVSEALARQVVELAQSLGGLASIRRRESWFDGRRYSDAWVVRTKMPAGMCPFRLGRKAAGWRPGRTTRKIVKVEVVGAEPTQCISVAASDSLYVAEHHIVTHNTKLAAKVALGKARERNQMIWWVAPTYKVVKRGYREVLRQLPAGTLAKPAPPDTHFDAGRSVILKFKNGTQIEFYSAERPEGMLGEGVDYAVLDEAAIMPPNIWEQVVRPTLMDREGGALLISTPRGRNYFFKAFQRGQDPESTEWASWQFPSWTNIHLPEGEIEEMRRDLPAVLFAQEVEAKFIAEGSSIFIIPPQIIKPLAKPSGHVVLGIDLAKTVDYTVIYGANSATRQNCVFERFQDVTWPRQRRRIVKLCNNLYAQGVTGITLMVDGTGVGDPMVDELEELGYDVIGLNFTTYKDKMVRLLAKDMEDGKAFVVQDHIDEFEAYSITQTPKGRVQYGAPAGGHDDVVSAKMLQHWGVVMEGVPEVHVIDGVDTDVDYSQLDFESDEEEPVNAEPDYFMDYDDDAVDTGVPVVRHIPAPKPDDLWNNPAVWG